MPLARIEINRDASPELVRVVSEAVYKAMVEIANAPPHDKFQIINRHTDDEIIFPKEGYLGLTYTRNLIIIQVTWVSGRSTEVKKKFYRQIAEEKIIRFCSPSMAWSMRSATCGSLRI